MKFKPTKLNTEEAKDLFFPVSYKGLTREILLRQRPGVVRTKEEREVIRQAKGAFGPLMEWADEFSQSLYDDGVWEEQKPLGSAMRLPRTGASARTMFRQSVGARLRFIKMGAGYECEAKYQYPYVYTAALHFISDSISKAMTKKNLETACEPKENKISPWIEKIVDEAVKMACSPLGNKDWKELKEKLDMEIEQKVIRMFGQESAPSVPKARKAKP